MHQFSNYVRHAFRSAAVAADGGVAYGQSGVRQRPAARSRRAAATVLATTAFAAGLLSVTAGPASAGTVQGCAQSYSAEHGTCISVDTGDKSNGQQWVSSITVSAPAAAESDPSTFEAWAGQGTSGVAWYNAATETSSVTWSIDQWIDDQSGICGAYTWTDGSGRSIACITISA